MIGFQITECDNGWILVITPDITANPSPDQSRWVFQTIGEVVAFIATKLNSTAERQSIYDKVRNLRPR